MSMLSAAKVLNIPELLEMILEDFTTHDFTQCILVCKAFSKVFTPILWHTISLKQQQQYDYFTTAPAVQEAILKNAIHIRVIQVRTYQSLQPFLALEPDMMPYLHTLQLPCYNNHLGSFAVDNLYPCLEQQQQQQGPSIGTTARINNTSTGEITQTLTSTPTPTKDWLRYRGMFMMRRHTFVQLLYQQRRLFEMRERREALQQKKKDDMDIRRRLLEGEERIAQMEQECLLLEKKFPVITYGLEGPAVERDLMLLRKKVQETKEEMEQLRTQQQQQQQQRPGLSFGVQPTLRATTAAERALATMDPTVSLDQEQREGEILEQFLSRFTQIQTFACATVPFFPRGLIPAVVRLENLRSLSLTIFLADLSRQVSHIHTLLTACPPNLEILRLSFKSAKGSTPSSEDIFFAESNTATPTAEIISTSGEINTTTNNDNNNSNDDDEIEVDLDLLRLSAKRSGPIRSLRRLFIEGTLEVITASKDNNCRIVPSPDSQTWIAFLERCPNLLTLSLGECSARLLPEIGRSLQLYCPHLEDLVVGYFSLAIGSSSQHDLLDTNLAILLSSLTSGLKRLRLDTLAFAIKSQVLAVIQNRHSDTLLELSINDCKYNGMLFMEEVHSIFSVLRSCRKLDSIDLLPSGEIFHAGQHFFGCATLTKQVFSRPWTCTGSLRVLRIAIDGILRKAPTYSNAGVQDMENSRLWQRRACQFLGSFPQLEELSLGVLASSMHTTKRGGGGGGRHGRTNSDIVDLEAISSPSAEDHEQGPAYAAYKFVGVQSKCLMLTLDHGLELMGGLKRLKVFNVTRMDHRIETDELEFMLDQWPQLEFVPGLLRSGWYQEDSGRPEERREARRLLRERDEAHRRYTMDRPATPSSACSRFFNITELVLVLARLLDKNELAKLVKTNRRINTICTSLLYAKQDFFMVTSVSTSRILDTLEAMSAFSRNIHGVERVVTGPLFASFYYHCLLAYYEQLEQSGQQTLLTPPPLPPSGSHPVDTRTVTMVPVGPMTNLKSFTYEDYYAPRYLRHHAFVASSQYPRARQGQLYWMLPQFPNLSVLRMELWMNDQQDFQMLAKALPHLRALKKLNLRITRDPNVHRWSQLIPALFLNCPPSIEDLEFYFLDLEDADFDQLPNLWGDQDETQAQTQAQDQDGWSMERMRRSIQEPLHNLRSLDLSDVSQLSFDDLVSIFDRAPAVTELHIPNLGTHIDITRMAQSISESCPRIKRVYQHGRLDEDQEFALEVVHALPEQQLEFLSYADLRWCADVVAVVQRHSTTLRELRLVSCLGVRSKAIQTILCTGHVLEVLWIEPYQLANSAITLDDAIAAEWACTRMQQLQIAVSNVPIVAADNNNEEPYYKRPAPIVLTGYERNKFSQLELFYRQIGRLTEMVHLKLMAVPVPVDCEEVDSAWRTGAYSDVWFPSMLSLGDEATGRPGYLSLFGGLKKMRSFNGSVRAKTPETRVTIGQNEAEWIIASWPKLEVIDFCSSRPRDDDQQPGGSKDSRTCFEWLVEQRSYLNLFGVDPAFFSQPSYLT
ncbi:hypothetical protein BGX23_000936 [Mortierella sp. AD031]|nr:hypothetical protein BGX23_000936 [Mortierella sp. AD031]